MKKMNLLSKAEMREVIGGVEATGEQCIIYTIDSSTGHRMMYYQPVDASQKEASAQSLYAITGQHAYWDCNGDGYQHTYYVS